MQALGSRQGEMTTDELALQLSSLSDDHEFVFTMDCHGIINWVADSCLAILGQPTEELISTAFLQHVHPDDVIAARRLLDATTQLEADVRLIDSSGGSRWLNVRLSPYRPCGETESAWIGKAMDRRRRTFPHHLSDVVWEENREGAIQWISPSVSRLIGWEPGDLEGRRIYEYTHHDDISAMRSIRDDVARGQIRRMAVRLLGEAGTEAWVSLVLHPRISADGDIDGLVGSMHDITTIIEAREALAESQAQYRILAENAADIVFRCGLNQRITWVSDTIHRELGWNIHEMIGSDGLDLIHPDDRDGSSPFDGIARRWRQRDGGFRWFSGVAHEVFDEDGQVTGFVAGMQCVDELVAARSQAHRDRERLEAMLDAMFDPHVVLQPVRSDAGHTIDFIYVDVNRAAAEHIGRSKSDLIGQRLLHVFPMANTWGIFQIYLEILVTGEPFEHSCFKSPRPGRDGDRYYEFRGTSVDDLIVFTWRDVTQHQNLLRDLASSESRYRLLVENSSDVIVHLDTNAVVLWSSPSLSDALGWIPEELLGRNIFDLVHPDDIEVAREHRLRAEFGPVTGRARMRHRDMGYHWVEVHGRPYMDASDLLAGYVLSLHVVDNQVAIHQEMDRLIRFDGLTGLSTRRTALAHLETAAASRRQPGLRTALMFCDIDRFKAINDEFGHAIGDRILVAVAQRLLATVRQFDLVARIGGDELLIIVERVHTLDEAVALAEKVRREVCGPLPEVNIGKPVTISIGVTLIEDGEPIQHILERADQAMYQAKNNGRNQVCAIKPG